MNKNTSAHRASTFPKRKAPALALATLIASGIALDCAARAGEAAPAASASGQPIGETIAATDIAPRLDATLNKSTLVRLPAPVARMAVGNPAVADIVLIHPKEIYVLGKRIGATNLLLWEKSGRTTVVDVSVNIDTVALQEKLRQLLPGENAIQVRAAADSVVLTGTVSDALRAGHAVSIAKAYVRRASLPLDLPVQVGEGKEGQTIKVGSGMVGTALGMDSDVDKKVVNLLHIAAPQQVMLEVKIAEVSKNLLDRFGINFARQFTAEGGGITNLISGILGGAPGLLARSYNSGQKLGPNPQAGALGSQTLLATQTDLTPDSTSLGLDAEKKDGLIKILAEPTIMAISGQEGSFLAGGRIFIPVARKDTTGGGATITLEEKEFGVSLRFTPTVLDGNRINLQVAPEVSELSRTGSPFTTVNGVTSVLPSITTRKASTTVQLRDGQSFAIAGLIKNNVNETIKAFPVLGELPVLGALFRSSEFQSDRTELMFVVTPRLVRPLPPDYALPTDGFVEPSRAEFFLQGKMEGAPPAPQEPLQSPQTRNVPPPGAPSGFEMK